MQREKEQINRETILHIANCIQEIKEVKEKENNGSLLELFTSSLSNIHIILYYLNTHDSNSIIDVLINQLTTSYANTSFSYLPQIIAMISDRTYNEPIEHFLLDQCINHIKFSVIVYWLVLANNSSSSCKGKYNDLINKIELTLVNGHRPFVKQYSITKLSQISKDIITQNTLNKQLRLDYFDKVKVFYEKLKSLCENLKTITSSDRVELFILRDQALMKQITHINHNISSMYTEVVKQNSKKCKLIHLFRGVILPFNDSDEVNDENNNIIVNILNQHSFCFNTKARVPVKLVVECIRVYECESWDKLYINDQDRVSITKEKTKNSDEDFNQSIICYNSINEFLKHLSIEDEEKQAKDNSEKINQILSEVNDANEHPSKAIQDTSEFSQLINPNKISIIHLSETSGTLLTIKPFGKKWSNVVSNIKANSPFRNFQTYSIKSFIAKANDDLRQELLTMQLIKHFSNIFKQASIPLTLFCYEILITSPSSGLVEFLPNTISIDALKKQLPDGMSLDDFFRSFFHDNFEEAQKNFAESLAGYSLITYLLNLKDRHNGNILLDLDGHIIHIDYGFILGISPGNLSFESAPFKLTNEYVKILDGADSFIFNYFKSLLSRGFSELRNHYESCAKLIEIISKSWDIPCFYQRKINEIMNEFEKRFHFEISEFEYQTLVDKLVKESLGNWRTNKYDTYQKYCNNIMP